MRKDAVAIEGSVKYRVGVERIAAFDRKFGFQESRSFITNI